MKAKAKDRITQLKKQFDRLRKDSVAAVGTANEAIYAGLQQFADKELKALHNYYENALSALKKQKKDGADVRSVVLTQLELMQNTFNELIANARGSLELVAKANDAAKAEAAAPAAAKKRPPAAKKAAKKAAAPRKSAPRKKAAATAPPAAE